MDYLARDFVENGNKPNLLATPNVIADWQTLRAIAVKFGERQPYETYVHDELYRHYSAEELSGEKTNGKLRFSVMPSGYSRRIGRSPAETQLATLQQLQVELPRLSLRVPSVLEAITYWHAWRAKDGSRYDFRMTDICHIDLKPVLVESWLSVPRSGGAAGTGELHLGAAGALNGRMVRVLAA